MEKQTNKETSLTGFEVLTVLKARDLSNFMGEIISGSDDYALILDPSPAHTVKWACPSSRACGPSGEDAETVRAAGRPLAI